MKTDPVTVGADTPTLKAMQLMRRERISCLMVVEAQRLVGLITEADLIAVSATLLERALQEP